MKRLALSRRVPAKLLIYGKPGSRKTTFAATAGADERSAPVLWLDAGGNPISALRVANAAKNIDVLTIEAITDLQDVYTFLAAGASADHKFAKINQLRGGYKTVVLDGITHIQRLGGDAISGALDLQPGATPAPLAWPQYRQVLAQMTLIAARFYTLPINVIITALEHPETRFMIPGDNTTSFIYREPALYGQSVDEFPGWALNVGRSAVADSYDPRIVKQLKAENAYSIVQFKPTRFIDAKDQHGLGDYLVDPTMTDVLDRIYGKQPAPAV